MMAPATRSGGTSASVEDSAENSLRAVVLAVRLRRVRDAHFQAGDVLEPIDQRGARGLGLLFAVAEVLARALVDDDGGDRRDRARGLRA